jgi:hypothetical protein
MVNRAANLSPARTTLTNDSDEEDQSLDASSIRRMLTKTRPPPDKKRKPLGGLLAAKPKPAPKPRITVQELVDGVVTERPCCPAERPQGQTKKHAHDLHEQHVAKVNDDLNTAENTAQKTHTPESRFTAEKAFEMARHMKKA